MMSRKGCLEFNPFPPFVQPFDQQPTIVDDRMAKNLSLTELTALYANKGKNPKALFEADVKSDLGTVLPGSTTADKLSKLFFTRQSGLLPLRPSTWKSDKEHNTIAICLVIVDTLYHEEIWRHWVEQGERAESNYKAQLFIHAKHPERITSPWVQERLIDVTFRPDWNSVEVVQSLLSVLDAALQYTPNIDTSSTNNNTASIQVGACGRFILATESCLPLYDLETTGEMLYKEDCSWLKAYHTPQGSWEAGTCFRSVDPEIVPPKAVWKSLPGWVMLNRLHAMEIVTLTKMLGGWGQPLAGSRSVEDVMNVAEYSNLFDPLYKDCYKGTPGLRWKETIVQSVSVGDDSVQLEITETVTVVTSPDADVASSGAYSVSTIDPVTVSVQTISNNSTTKTKPQPSLLSAWGAGGTWHEHNGSVFAPEEVFFPTMLSLLGYLRDSTSTDTGDATSTGVKIAAVTFVEWAKKGDANPIAYDYFDAQLVQRMRAAGAVFGRKFTQNSVTVSEWSRVVEDCGANNNTQHSSDHRQRSPQDRYHNDYNNTRYHNAQQNNRRDGDRYSNYPKNNRDYNDNNRYGDSRNNDTRNYHQRNYDNRNYNNDRYDSREGRDYSDNKRRKY